MVANLQPYPEERVGMKARSVVANLQPPLEDWRVGMEGKKSGC